jgi:hypothetical protein
MFKADAVVMRSHCPPPMTVQLIPCAVCGFGLAFSSSKNELPIVNCSHSNSPMHPLTLVTRGGRAQVRRGDCYGILY